MAKMPSTACMPSYSHQDLVVAPRRSVPGASAGAAPPVSIRAETYDLLRTRARNTGRRRPRRPVPPWPPLPHRARRLRPRPARSLGLVFERMFGYAGVVRHEDLDQPWKIENLRRSLAMLPPGTSGLSRDDSMLVLDVLADPMAQRPAQ